MIKRNQIFKGKSKIIALRVSCITREAIEKIADQKKVSLSIIIFEAIQKYLQSQKVKV